MNGGPQVAVVVPTHRRPLRLRWLLNALCEQDLDRGAFEVLVAHNTDDTPTAALLAQHPLRPRALALPPGAGPAALRNAGWRAASAPVIAFTDDDCRPPAGWLRLLLAAAQANPQAIVQGPTRPDPDELNTFHHAPHARSQQIEPPHVMAQTCNIAYPRTLLERVGGFDETFPQAVGEDTDLALRARAAGAGYVAAPEALTYHAVDAGLVRRLRGTWRWQHMALVVRKHPQLRSHMPLGGWAWKSDHVRWLLAAAGVAGLAARRPALALLALPWLAGSPRVYGSGPRAAARTVSELPGRFVLDGVETAALLRGSARYRSLLL